MFSPGRTFNTRTVSGGRVVSTKPFSPLRAKHSRTLDWRKRVLQVGGTVASNILDAVDDFSFALDNAGLLSKIIRLNLFTGDSLTSALTPFVRISGYSEDRNNGFVSGDWSQANGLKGNGTSKELHTGVQDAWVSIADLSMFFYGKEFEQTFTNHCAIGVLNGAGSPFIALTVRRTFAPGVPAFACSSFEDNFLVRELPFSTGQSEGFIGGSAQGLGPLVGYVNGVPDSAQPASTARTVPTGSTGRDFFVFSWHFSDAEPFNVATSAAGFGYGILKGLSSDEMHRLYQALRRFFSTINRS